LFFIFLNPISSQTILQAQQGYWNNTDNYPKEMTPQEKLISRTLGTSSLSSLPPTGPVRNIAEFERNEGVLIRYSSNSPLAWPLSLVAELSGHVMVIVIVADQSTQDSATGEFIDAGINMQNVSFLMAPTNSVWTRDYGPFYIIDENDRVSIVDFVYNRPARQFDNAIPASLGAKLEMPVYGMDLVHTGGNYMTDGLGIAASTDLVFEENNDDVDEVFRNMNDFMGVHTYHVTIDPQDTFIKHIDTWSKFLAPDKLLIARVPAGNQHYNEHEDVAAYFADQTSSYGTPFEIYRVDTPNGEPYTNSLIVNERVYVPLMNSANNDSAAINSYRKALPGYEIIGFLPNPEFVWTSTDALHCRVKEIPDRGMLHIGHIPLSGIFDYAPEIEIETEIIAYSGSDLIADSLFLIYRINEAPFDTVLLSRTGGNTFAGLFQVPPYVHDITYYFYAADESGRRENFPLIGKPGARTFRVNSPPELLSRTYMDGWNLVGLPSITGHSHFTQIFPYANDRSLYTFNGVYEEVQTMIPGKGYWLKMQHESDVSFSGLPINDITLQLTEGWNLISGPLQDIPVGDLSDTDDILIPGTFYTYDQGYVPANNLKAGIGYWVRTGKSGTISLTISDAPTLPGDAADIISGYEIVIESGNSTSSLYFGAFVSDPDADQRMFSLPPLPPRGVFDARLAGDVRLTESNIAEVELQRNEDSIQVTITSYEVNSELFRIQLFSNGDLTDEILVSAGEQFTLPDNIDFMEATIAEGTTALLDDSLPTSYVLEQNFPNPFNPSTIIRFALPVASHTQLEVFNLTGQRVATILNENVQAGYHVVPFDAEHLASGFYLLRLRAGEFTQTRKMLLVK